MSGNESSLWLHSQRLIDDIYRKEEGLPTLSLGVKWRKLFAATVLEVPALVFILGDLW
ncbi:18306_t:CDS:2 [Funneliformis geosporum]|uniref:18306_t:CDS:1 n=1 Tax=Funneliformis geosporum TaxID=1117311 RepID=A0A9W4WW86_9GLOM|nr:18306_t:CDS:2 [Funneliformis geosporum]